VESRIQHGWFGPANPQLQQPRRELIAGAPPRRVILPREVRGDLATIAAAARTAGNGRSAAGARLVSEAEALVVRRATTGPTTADYAHIGSMGADAWLDEQLDFEQLDNAALEDALHAAFPTLSLSAKELFQQYDDNRFIPIYELWAATFYRALYSPRQLFERMATFWSDHFSIDIFGENMELLKPVDDRDVVRSHTLGEFPALLSASAHSPAMLSYLTNDTNEKNHPNENYARELMELHTMGADRGYSEKDVKEVARCLTGWTWNGPYCDATGELGTFQFVEYLHDNRTKRVLGKTIGSGGSVNDGEQVLAILSGRKETADHIATKMLRWLHGYEPSEKLVKSVSKSYRRSDGDIRSMVRTALRAKHLGSATPKLKRPFHLMISALRAIGAEVEDVRQPLNRLAAAGHLPFAWVPPNGYPDTAQWWSSLLLPRWSFGTTIAGGDDVLLDPAADDPNASVGKIVDRLDTLLLNGAMTPATRTELTKFLNKRKNRERVRAAIALAIAAPEFQEY
jgi:uncharacterized protein (DUF1800 family)